MNFNKCDHNKYCQSDIFDIHEQERIAMIDAIGNMLLNDFCFKFAHVVTADFRGKHNDQESIMINVSTDGVAWFFAEILIKYEAAYGEQVKRVKKKIRKIIDENSSKFFDRCYDMTPHVKLLQLAIEEFGIESVIIENGQLIHIDFDLDIDNVFTTLVSNVSSINDFWYDIDSGCVEDLVTISFSTTNGDTFQLYQDGSYEKY